MEYKTHQVFGLAMPTTCADVPTEILNPRNTWDNKEAYDAKANTLASEFVKNFSQFADQASDEIMEAAPRVAVDA